MGMVWAMYFSATGTTEKVVTAIAAGAFVGEHAFSAVLGAGRPDEKDMEAARYFADRIDVDRESPVPVKGENPIRGYYQPRNRYGTPINILKVKPLTSDACDDCGIRVGGCSSRRISRRRILREIMNLLRMQQVEIDDPPSGGSSNLPAADRGVFSPR